MNSIRQIQELNKRELENGVSPEASWHTDYRDTAYVYIGGLPFELSEGDIITIFSQYGEPTYINLIRDKDTGKSRGFAFLKYEDQRSTDLAVDNLGGAVIMGRTLRVDHTRYKKKEDEPDEGHDLIAEAKQIADDESEDRRKRRRTNESENEDERPLLKEEQELALLIQNHDEEDPMKPYLIQEKREEVSLALARLKDKKSSKHHKHRHHKSRHSRKDGEGLGGERSSHHRREHRERKRSRSRDSSTDRHGRRPRLEDSKTDASYRRARSPRRESGGGERNDRDESYRRERRDSADDSYRRSRRDLKS